MGVGVSAAVTMFFELWLSSFLVQRRHVESKGLSRDIFYPLFITSLTTGPVLFFSWYLFPTNFLMQSVFGASTLGVLILVRELFTPWSILREAITSLSLRKYS